MSLIMSVHLRNADGCYSLRNGQNYMYIWQSTQAISLMTADSWILFSPYSDHSINKQCPLFIAWEHWPGNLE